MSREDSDFSPIPKALIPNVTRQTAGPFMMMAGMTLTIFASTKQGAILAVMLSLSGILVLGGMLLTYLIFVREGATVKPPAAITSDLDLAVEQLSRNYEWVRSQTMYAFFLSFCLLYGLRPVRDFTWFCPFVAWLGRGDK